MKRTWIIVFIAVLILSFVADFLLYRWSHIPGFFALFGFVGCVALIVISKLIGHYWLQRKEGYYDRDDDNE